MEWRLWDGDEPPFFTQRDFFAAHARIPGEHQVGYDERLSLVAQTVVGVRSMPVNGHFLDYESITDLGCGDGTLLERLSTLMPYTKMWGYDAGRANVEHAQSLGLDVVERDFVHEPFVVGDLVMLTEVLEHLADPHRFLRQLHRDRCAKILVATSPSGESDKWHYEHHAWAWDREGMSDMLVNAGWRPISADSCVARGFVSFGPSGEMKRPSFQCWVALR